MLNQAHRLSPQKTETFCVSSNYAQKGKSPKEWPEPPREAQERSNSPGAAKMGLNHGGKNRQRMISNAVPICVR